MAVNINVPSQVKTYANLAAFPATGALKTIYIAEDTNKTYRWTGSVYTEISASAAMTWGDIGGTLSNQTDLQNALDAKVPTSRTLTINGVTQDLSANRTFTISTGITIGSTAIASGVVGRVLFEGAGNVVQESSSLFWDATNNRLGIGTSSPRTNISIVGANDSSPVLGSANGKFTVLNGPTNGTYGLVFGVQGSGISHIQSQRVDGSATAYALAIQPAGGNVLIGTTTDAGFKLDVNGTARVQGATTISSGTNSNIRLSGTSIEFSRTVDGAYNTYITKNGSTNSVGLTFAALNSGNFFFDSTSRILSLFGSTLNVGINTTTDAGFRLDVNGTARVGVSGATTVLGDYNGGGQSSVAYKIDFAAGWGWGISNMAKTQWYFEIRSSGQAIFGSGTTSYLSLSASAKVQIDSTTQGFLPPRMTTTQKNAIASPAAGLMVYDTTLNVISYYNGSMWI